MNRSSLVRCVLCATAAVLLQAGPVLAKDDAAPPTAQERAAKIDRRVHEKLGPKLQLDDATADKLATVLKDAAAQRATAKAAVKVERDALQVLVDKGARPAELDAQLDRLKAAAAKLPSRGAVFEQTRRVLTPTQQAKLVLAKHGHKGERGERGGRGEKR